MQSAEQQEAAFCRSVILSHVSLLLRGLGWICHIAAEIIVAEIICDPPNLVIAAAEEDGLAVMGFDGLTGASGSPLVL